MLIKPTKRANIYFKNLGFIMDYYTEAESKFKKALFYTGLDLTRGNKYVTLGNIFVTFEGGFECNWTLKQK